MYFLTDETIIYYIHIMNQVIEYYKNETIGERNTGSIPAIPATPYISSK